MAKMALFLFLFGSLLAMIGAQESEESVVENEETSNMLFYHHFHDAITMTHTFHGGSVVMVVIEAVVLLLLISVIAIITYKCILKKFHAGMYKLSARKLSKYYNESELCDYDAGDHWDEESNSQFGTF